MADEKRRFFRINEHIGLSYEPLSQRAAEKTTHTVADLEVLVGSQTDRIDQLLADVSAEAPKVAELVDALNHKLELVLRQLLEAQLANGTFRPMREVNISACGLGFWSDHDNAPGSHWRLVLELSPSEKKIQCKGILIACEKAERGFYWRFDFYGMSSAKQELLIQHLVQRQGAQLKLLRGL
jgi:hypothetical protein